MTDLLQLGQHPDADVLSAFAEDALPVHERQQTLAHLALCEHCRRILSLALPPFEEAPQAQLVPVRKPWFRSWRLALPAAAFAAAALLVFAVHRHAVAPTNQTTLTAHNEAPKLEPSASPSATAAATDVAPAPPKMPSIAAARPIAPAAAAKQAESSTAAASSNGTLEAQTVQDLPINGRSYTALTQNLASGTPAAAAPAPQAPAASLSGEVAAARGMPAPPPAATTQSTTVDVAADAAALETTSATSAALIAAPLRNLPGHRTIASTITRDSQTLALDTTGALFVSFDNGLHWKAVPTQWQGRAVHLTLAVYPARTGGGSGASAIGGPLTTAAMSNDTAAITGTVTDSSGAVIGGATILLKDASGHLIRSIKADSRGAYALTGLPSGTYQLEVSSPGFVESHTVTTLATAQQKRLNLSLAVGSASETVTVAAASPQLAIESAPRQRSLAKAAAPKAQPSILPLFELTTETGDHWTSPDGQTWKHN